MQHITKIILFLIFTSGSYCYSQSPVIAYASSFYRTTAGAIGPTGIISTTTYDLKINSARTIILDSSIISGFKILGDGIIIPTNKDEIIEFRILIATHQKDTVWYNGELEHEGIRVSAHINKTSSVYVNNEQPAIILYLRSGKSRFSVIKSGFDNEQSQFNK